MRVRLRVTFRVREQVRVNKLTPKQCQTSPCSCFFLLHIILWLWGDIFLTFVMHRIYSLLYSICILRNCAHIRHSGWRQGCPSIKFMDHLAVQRRGKEYLGTFIRHSWAIAHHFYVVFPQFSQVFFPGWINKAR